MTARTEALAARLEQGARALAELAASLTTAEWESCLPHDGRRIGVVVHHVATMYPLEIDLARMLARGEPIVGVTWDTVAQINAEHAREHDGATPEETLALLRRNAADAAAAIRAMSDAELDSAAPLSLDADAPLTCQFMLEDHAVRHSWHHLAAIRRALAREGVRVAA